MKPLWFIWFAIVAISITITSEKTAWQDWIGFALDYQIERKLLPSEKKGQNELWKKAQEQNP